MSDIIRLLPDSVANQIAAGEVIQRPASVVKELVENAIDAQAKHIQLLVTDAGKSCIQVIDDGIGMSETDARLSFERHATSKISVAADLFDLHTMGFRGEALASIAAVAQVELRTRTRTEELGVSIVIEGSKLKEQLPISCPVGANFSVRNLFFNVPARRKFLKSNQTEMSNIMMEFERIALAHPDVFFTLHANGAVVLNLPEGNFRQRIVSVFGKKIDNHLVPVSVETALAKIDGFVGEPRSARKKGAQQYFFVNGRYMRHPYFAKAVMTAYDRLIPEGEQVPYFLRFEVDPAKIDVNIHPSKTEIKFQDEQPLWQILLAAVREALGKYSAVPTIDFDTENRPDIPVFQPGRTDNIEPPQIHVDNSYNPFEREATRGGYPYNTRRQSANAAPADWQQAFASALQATSGFENGNREEQPKLYDDLPQSEQAVWTESSAGCFQLMNRYIVVPVSGGLLFVEQHRAHMRILYDMYMQQVRDKSGVAQGLLFPQMVQFQPSAAALFDTLLDGLTLVGFDISPLGGGSYSVMGIPAGTEGGDPVRLLQDLLSDVSEGNDRAADKIPQIIALSLARRAAVSAGQELQGDEMSTLLRDLSRTSNAVYDPMGKRIQYLLSEQSIQDFFK